MSAAATTTETSLAISLSVVTNATTFQSGEKYTVLVVVCADEPAAQTAGLFTFDATKTVTFVTHALKRGAAYHAIAFHFYANFNPFPESKRCTKAVRRVGVAVLPFDEDDVQQDVKWDIISERGWPIASFKHITVTRREGILFSQRPSFLLPSELPQAKIPSELATRDVLQHMQCTLKGVRLPIVLAVAATAFGQPSLLHSSDHIPLFRAWLSLVKSNLGLARILTTEDFATNISLRREFVAEFFCAPFRGLVYSGDFMPDPKSGGRFVATEEWCPLTFMPDQHNASFDCEDCSLTILHIYQAFMKVAFDLSKDSELHSLQYALRDYTAGFGVCKIRENVTTQDLAWHAMCVLIKTDYLKGVAGAKAQLMLVDATHSFQHDLLRSDTKPTEAAGTYERYKDWLDTNTPSKWPVVWRLTTHLKMPASKIRQHDVYRRLYSVTWSDGAEVKQSLMPVTNSLIEYFDSEPKDKPVTIASVGVCQLLGIYRHIASANPPPRIPRAPLETQQLKPLPAGVMRIVVKAPTPEVVHTSLKSMIANDTLKVTLYELFAGCFVHLYDFKPAPV